MSQHNITHGPRPVIASNAGISEEQELSADLPPELLIQILRHVDAHTLSQHDITHGPHPLAANKAHIEEQERSSDLPPELLIQVLRQVDVYTLLQCKLVCKQFNNIVNEEFHLQYALELAKAGYVDGPQVENGLPVFERFQRLKKHRTAWNDLRFDLLPIKLVDHGRVRQWKFQSGVLVVAYLRNATGEPFGKPRTYDTLDIYFLRCQKPDLVYRRHRLGSVYEYFAIDIAEDLIVVWNRPRTWLPTLQLHPKSLSSGTSHNRFFRKLISCRFIDEWTKDSAISIRGPLLAVGGSLSTDLYDWTHREPTQTTTVISSGHIFLSKCCMVRVTSEAPESGIEVLALQRNSAKPIDATIVAYFELPTSQQYEWVYSHPGTGKQVKGISNHAVLSYAMSCHASAPCDWGRTHGELFPPSSPLPFSTSPDVLPLCLINLELEGEDVTLSHTIVTYTRPFLAIANKYMRLSTQGKDSFRSS